MRKYGAEDVFNKAIDRMKELYESGNRPVVSFSAGKDSGVLLEVCIIAAKETGHLPVDVVMRDEEIMFPGTFEYAERMHDRPEVNFRWLIAGQPIINIFDRTQPYWWTFDPACKEKWVRQPPKYAEWISDLCIDSLTTRERFPTEPGKILYQVMGLRASESRSRMLGIYSSKGWLTKPNAKGVATARPIFDWDDGDVWKAVLDNKWDYNRAYDVMHRMGVARNMLRIAPPTLTASGIPKLQVAARAWPQWFDKVCLRLPGLRTVVQFGKRAVMPHRRAGETWEDCFKRECITEAPAKWIADRSIKVMEDIQAAHRAHSTMPLPQSKPCAKCRPNATWRSMAIYMYNGDPFSMKYGVSLPYIEPEFFRPGAGKWEGKPSF